LTKPAFLVSEKGVKKVEGGKVIDSDANEMNGVLANYRGGRVVLDAEVMKVLEEKLGKFDVSL